MGALVMADPAPVPQALVEAMELRRRRRRNRGQWQIVDNGEGGIESLAASVNQAKHQRLSDAFRPEGWISEY
jgi:hypothetical protein